MNAMRLEDMINANYTHLNENDHEIWKFIKERMLTMKWLER